MFSAADDQKLYELLSDQPIQTQNSLLCWLIASMLQLYLYQLKIAKMSDGLRLTW